MSAGAARVFLTLDELADLMRLPEGHRLHAVDELPAGYCAGISLTIVNEEGARPYLGSYCATEPLRIMDLAAYRRFLSNSDVVVRSTLRPVETPVEAGCADDCTHPAHRNTHAVNRPYTPARAPIGGSDPDNWPPFPGQHLPITGEPVRGDPGDEDTHPMDHFGGPR